MSIPWPDELAMLLCAFSDDDKAGESRQHMKTILRYAHLCHCLGLRDFSATARERFPAMQNLICEGIFQNL